MRAEYSLDPSVGPVMVLSKFSIVKIFRNQFLSSKECLMANIFLERDGGMKK